MQYLARHLAEALRRASRTFPAILVTGPRQCGKTTLLREELGKTHRYVSLERPDVRDRAARDPVAFLDENSPPVILDEIQQAPDLLHHIKDRIDADRKPGRWILSGSQSFPLMRGITQTLAGRIAILKLAPLSVGEAAGLPAAGSLDDLLDRVFGGKSRARALAIRRGFDPDDTADWLLRGGYPEPRANPAVDRNLWFSSYVQTYLERDVRDLIQVGDLRDFGRFLALIAASSGRLLNFADLAREIGVTGPTAKRWLSVLEASQIVTLLRPYHRNFGKRLTKAPKVALNDPGLATWLLGLHAPEALMQGPNLGALFETAVISEWIKAIDAAGDGTTLHHWRASGGLEIDLVIERDGLLYGIEAKATATPTPQHAEPLGRWLELAGPKARGVIACRVEEPVTLRPSIRAVPWHFCW